MAKITLTFFKRAAAVDGVPSSAGGAPTGHDSLTAAGSADAAPAGSKLVRIATDTAFTSNVYGAGTETLHPANSAELFPVKAGQIVTFTAVA
jgi:hypothetical protein